VGPTSSCCGSRAHNDGLRFFVRITRDGTKELPLNLNDLCDDQQTVYTIRSKLADAQEESGFILPELMVTMVINRVVDVPDEQITYALSVSGSRRALLGNGQSTVEFVEPGGLTFEYLNEFGDPATGEADVSMTCIWSI
jgi:hypothetical protein